MMREGRESRDPLHRLVQLKNIHQVQKYLSDNVREDLQHIRDGQDNTLIHLACSWGKQPLLVMYLKHQRDILTLKYPNNEDMCRKTLQAWANEYNKEGFTAMHYASHEDNLDMIRVLEDLHCNVMATTKTGLNMLHMAAQSDALDSAIHFRETIDINSTDDKGMTALHWAAYLSSEAVASLLISLGCDLNPQDKQKDTPLHLAARYGNTRILRRLLMHGADRHRVNAKGETALMISRDNQFKNISRMLDDDYGCFDQVRFYFNVQMKYEPQSRSLAMPLLFLLSTLLVVGTTHTLLQINIDALPQEYYLLAPLGFYYIVFFGVYLSLLGSPKGVEKGSQYQSLIGKEEVCTQCICEKEERSYHCQICKTCIRRYDHHCPWINGCVGQRNIKRFIVFLLLLIITIAENAVLAAFGIFQLWTQWRFNFNTTIELVQKIVLGVDLAVCVIFFFPLLSLVWVQLTNLCLNKTTFERYSKAKPKSTSKEEPSTTMTGSDISEPLNRRDSRSSSVMSREEELDDTESSCSLSNCLVMCSDSRPTRPLLSQITESS